MLSGWCIIHVCFAVERFDDSGVEVLPDGA